MTTFLNLLASALASLGAMATRLSARIRPGADDTPQAGGGNGPPPQK